MVERSNRGGWTLLENGARAVRVTKEDRLSESNEGTGRLGDEGELLEGFRRGEVSVFERLYQIEGPRMKSVAANLLGNVADAEDAVQETFLKVYRASSAFQGGSRVSTWVYRILVNSCYDVLRRRKRRREEGLESAAERPLESRSASSDVPLKLALERSVSDLPARPRTAFVLFEVEGFSHREIGQILGIPEASSRTLLFEAKRRLQRALASFPRAEGARA